VKCGIKVVCLTGWGHGPYVAGEWLESYDPDANEGRGYAEFTRDPARALSFESMADAWACWNQQSRVRPLREDGQPNKPLTAFTITVENLP
jgi:hypothetical protein